MKAARRRPTAWSLDGQPGVLMTIQKNGSVSTLDIIAGIKQRLPEVRQIVPPDLDIRAVGDKSVFVKQSVSAVIREGAIAAGLTALMILLFLGTWRSTLHRHFHSARHPHIDHRPLAVGRDDQRNDAGWARARGRDPGR